jgi:exonuclease SbcC
VRILAIRGERLASLHEPFEVDFDQAPLAGAGLFAITGPTGAGKSTLLDAVCLALYGDTPRVHGNGGADIALGLDEPDKDQKLGAKDARHLLSRGSKRGHAEVDFRGQDGVHYRARWSVDPRPRIGDLDGPAMSLVRIADQEVLATGPKDTRQKVIQLVGFTFEEFQKAVLLPQGQFAEFLRASAKDRAEILEKVAGERSTRGSASSRPPGRRSRWGFRSGSRPKPRATTRSPTLSVQPPPQPGTRPRAW